MVMMITIVLDYYSVGGWMRMDMEMKERDECKHIIYIQGAQLKKKSIHTVVSIWYSTLYYSESYYTYILYPVYNVLDYCSTPVLQYKYTNAKLDCTPSTEVQYYGSRLCILCHGNHDAKTEKTHRSGDSMTR